MILETYFVNDGPTLSHTITISAYAAVEGMPEVIYIVKYAFNDDRGSMITAYPTLEKAQETVKADIEYTEKYWLQTVTKG